MTLKVGSPLRLRVDEQGSRAPTGPVDCGWMKPITVRPQSTVRKFLEEITRAEDTEHHFFQSCKDFPFPERQCLSQDLFDGI